MMRSYSFHVPSCCHRSSSAATRFHPNRIIGTILFWYFIVLLFNASFFLLCPFLFIEDGELEGFNPKGVRNEKAEKDSPYEFILKISHSFNTAHYFLGHSFLLSVNSTESEKAFATPTHSVGRRRQLSLELKQVAYSIQCPMSSTSTQHLILAAKLNPHCSSSSSSLVNSNQNAF